MGEYFEMIVMGRYEEARLSLDDSCRSDDPNKDHQTTVEAVKDGLFEDFVYFKAVLLHIKIGKVRPATQKKFYDRLFIFREVKKGTMFTLVSDDFTTSRTWMASRKHVYLGSTFILVEPRYIVGNLLAGLDRFHVDFPFIPVTSRLPPIGIVDVVNQESTAEGVIFAIRGDVDDLVVQRPFMIRSCTAVACDGSHEVDPKNGCYSFEKPTMSCYVLRVYVSSAALGLHQVVVALRSFARLFLKEEILVYYCTEEPSPDELRRTVREVMAAYQAAGITFTINGWYRTSFRKEGQSAPVKKIRIASIVPSRLLPHPDYGSGDDTVTESYPGKSKLKISV